METKYVESPKINKKVAKVIEELKGEIVSCFHPRSIILSGSFGRGEATVVEENGKLKFISDCEIILIPYKWIFNRQKLDKFQQDFYKRTGLKIGIWGFTNTLYLCFPFFRRRIRPTIANYDLKYGSKVIYGKNYLERIPSIQPKDIPLWEGIKLILNRMAEALEHFSLNSNDEMLFWTDKIVLACQDSLLLLLNKYTSSYKKRNEKFIEVSSSFDLQSIQILVKLAKDATNRKIRSAPIVPVNKRLEYWFKVQKICDEVLIYILREGYNIKFDNYIEFQEKYLKSKLKNYTTLPFDNIILQNLFRFLRIITTQKELPNFKILLRPYRPWDHIIYTCIPLVYFALEKTLKINVNYLKKISKILYWEDIRADSSFESWEIIKNHVIQLWRQMRL